MSIYYFTYLPSHQDTTIFFHRSRRWFFSEWRHTCTFLQMHIGGRNAEERSKNSEQMYGKNPSVRITKKEGIHGEALPPPKINAEIASWTHSCPVLLQHLVYLPWGLAGIKMTTPSASWDDEPHGDDEQWHPSTLANIDLHYKVTGGIILPASTT